MAILQSKLFDGTKSDCGTRYLADRPDMYDLQRSNNFELIVEFDGDIPSAYWNIDQFFIKCNYE